MFQSLIHVITAVALLQSPPPTVYRDPLGRFSFAYPAAFGATSPGTGNGYRDRVAALRFASFPARFGGEPALTRGFTLVDLQALGGLYDNLTLDIFPEPLRALVVSQLPRITIANFCTALAQPRHLDAKIWWRHFKHDDACRCNGLTLVGATD